MIKNKHYTSDEKMNILKAALKTQEGINAILEQTGKNFRCVVGRYKDGDDTDLNMLMILMIIAAGLRKNDQRKVSAKKWKQYTMRIPLTCEL